MYMSREYVAYNSSRTISVEGRQMLIDRVDDDDNPWEREGESDRNPKAPGSGTEDVTVGCHGSVILSVVGRIASTGDAMTVPSLLLWELLRFWIWRSSGFVYTTVTAYLIGCDTEFCPIFCRHHRNMAYTVKKHAF